MDLTLETPYTAIGLTIETPQPDITLAIEAVVRQGGNINIVMVNPVKAFFYIATGSEGNILQPQDEQGNLLSLKYILEFKRNNEELWPVQLDETGEQLYPENEEYAYNENGTFTIANDFDGSDKIKILYREK